MQNLSGNLMVKTVFLNNYQSFSYLDYPLPIYVSNFNKIFPKIKKKISFSSTCFLVFLHPKYAITHLLVSRFVRLYSISQNYI